MQTSRFKNAEVLVVLIILLASYFLWKSFTKDKRIKNNHIVVCGTILSSSYSKGNYITVEYFFNDKVFKKLSDCTVTTKNDFEQGRKRLLIALENNFPDNYKILENAIDLENFSISNIDTLGVLCNISK